MPSKGRDAFGRFDLVEKDCPCCSKASQLVVWYHNTPDIPQYALNSPSLLIRLSSTRIAWRVGITCGCYAKLHRQVAHIMRDREWL